MIKLFGQIRYHWQPELSLAISYWSLALLPFFIALTLIYEKTKQPRQVFLLMGITVVMTLFGFHRYFIIDSGDRIKIVSFNIFAKRTLAISSIKKVEISKYRFSIETSDGKKRVFFMRKWPRKYFLDALAIHPYFQGEVELVDNQGRLDYFQIYHKKQQPNNRP